MLHTDEYRITRGSLASLARHIPFRTMLTEHDVVTHRGELIRIWRLCRAASQPDARWLHRYQTSLCPPLQRVTGGRFALWLHRLPERSAATADPLGQPPLGASSMAMPQDETYISLVVRPGWRARLRRLFPLKSTASTPYSKEVSLMECAAATVAEQLARLQPHLLGDYFVEGRHHNEAFDLLSFLVNGIWASRTVAAGQLQCTLPCKRLLQSQMSSGLTTCAKCKDELHPFPVGVWSEQVCCGTPGPI